MPSARIPLKIDNPPLVEAIIELRFTSRIPGDLLVGQLHALFSDDFPTVIKLAAADIPSQLRSVDQNIRYAPHYSLEDEKYRIGIGTNVISIACKIDQETLYPGWAAFSSVFESCIEKFSNSPQLKIDDFERIGIRFINKLEIGNLWSITNLKLDSPFDTSDAKESEFYLGLTIEENSIKSNLRVAANANIVVDGKIASATIIDVDSYIEAAIPLNEIIANADKAHERTKFVFFNVLEDEYVKSFNPEY